MKRKCRAFIKSNYSVLNMIIHEHVLCNHRFVISHFAHEYGRNDDMTQNPHLLRARYCHMISHDKNLVTSKPQ